jgi:hypothetical protein
MTNKRRCHDVYVAFLAPMGLDPAIDRRTVVEQMARPGPAPAKAGARP